MGNAVLTVKKGEKFCVQTLSKVFDPGRSFERVIYCRISRQNTRIDGESATNASVSSPGLLVGAFLFIWHCP
jgi:hypothetical protein